MLKLARKRQQRVEHRDSSMTPRARVRTVVETRMCAELAETLLQLRTRPDCAVGRNTAPPSSCRFRGPPASRPTHCAISTPDEREKTQSDMRRRPSL